MTRYDCRPITSTYWSGMAYATDSNDDHRLRLRQHIRREPKVNVRYVDDPTKTRPLGVLARALALNPRPVVTDRRLTRHSSGVWFAALRQQMTRQWPLLCPSGYAPVVDTRGSHRFAWHYRPIQLQVLWLTGHRLQCLSYPTHSLVFAYHSWGAHSLTTEGQSLCETTGRTDHHNWRSPTLLIKSKSELSSSQNHWLAFNSCHTWTNKTTAFVWLGFYDCPDIASEVYDIEVKTLDPMHGVNQRSDHFLVYMCGWIQGRYWKPFCGRFVVTELPK